MIASKRLDNFGQAFLTGTLRDSNSWAHQDMEGSNQRLGAQQCSLHACEPWLVGAILW